jgi:hypothetical protein
MGGGALYGHRSTSSASSASPPASGGPPVTSSLVVPQPINAAKMGGHPLAAASGHTNGTSNRKYQCKMCPQVGTRLI